MNDIKNNTDVFSVSQYNHSKQFIFFFEYFIKNDNVYFAYFMKCMAATSYDKHCCVTTVVTTRVARLKRSCHLTPLDNGKMCTCNHTQIRTVWGTVLCLLAIFFHDERIAINALISFFVTASTTWKANHNPLLRLGLWWASQIPYSQVDIS